MNPSGIQGRRPLWHWLLLAATVWPMLGIVLGQLSAWSWYGELACHWTLHGAVAMLPALVVFRRDQRWGRILMVLLVVAIVPWLQAAWSPRAQVLREVIASASVATANVQFYNGDRAATQVGLAALDVDLLALEEVTASDEMALRQNPRWPFQVWSAPNDLTKVALLSRRRIVSQRLLEHEGTTVIEALVDLGESPLRVYVIHPKAPVSDELAHQRDRQLALLARELSGEAHPEPVLVLGDFNLSQGAPLWRSFTGYTGLRRAPGPAPATWPAILGPCGIAIDHVLARGAGLAAPEAFSVPGSDHRGLRTTVTVSGDPDPGTAGFQPAAAPPAVQ